MNAWRTIGLTLCVLATASLAFAQGGPQRPRWGGGPPPGHGAPGDIEDRDTSELLYVHPEGVREDLLWVSAHDGARGVNGDPTRASREIGRQMIDLKVRAAVEQIRAH